MKHVVFDIGAVLIDWQPHLAWIDELGRAGAQSFMERTNFEKINLACDAGASFATIAAEITDVEDSIRIANYVERFSLTLPDKIDGTWDCLYGLKDRGVCVHAITNWSFETWPEGIKAHPELGQVFETTVISGQVGIIKPSTRIFQLFCDRAGVSPDQCIFVDDSLHNCIGARAVGMEAIPFTNSDALQEQLREKEML